MTKTKLDFIQLLRAVAAIAVVLYHAAIATPKYSPFPARSLEFFSFGAYGVDLFFVISGFVIFYTTNNISASQFVRRRIERIVPIYWLYTVLALLITLELGAGAGFSWQKFFLSISFISFFLGDAPLMYVGWTLEYEMLFYSFVAVSLFIWRRPWPSVCTLISGLIVLGALTSPDSAWGKFISASMMLEFLMGILVGQALIGKRIGVVEACSVTIAALTVLLADESHRALIVGIPATVLLIIAVKASSYRLPKWVLEVGDASYSIYLVQVFTISACSKGFQRLLPSLDPDLCIVVTTLITIIVGMASYSFVEVKLRSILRTWPSIGQNVTV